MPRHRFAAWAAITVVSLLHLISHAPWQRDAHLSAWGDALSYWRMFEQSWAPVDNPFALRVLTPRLVRTAHEVTGIDPNNVWLALTFGATLAACITLFELLRVRLKVSVFGSLLGALLLASTYWYAPYAYSNPWLVDPLNNVLVVAAMWLLLRPLTLRGLVAFTALIIVGSVNKETALLLMPLYPLLAFNQVRRLADRTVLAAAGATLAAAAAYLTYRAWATAQIGGAYELGAASQGSLLDNLRFSLSSNGNSDQLALWSVFGGLWLVCAFGLYRLYREHGTSNPLLISAFWVFGCCLAGRLVATDTQRVFAMLAPLIIAIASVELDRHRGEVQRFWLLVLGVTYAAGQLAWVTPSVVADLVVVVLFGGLIATGAWNRKIPSSSAPSPAMNGVLHVRGEGPEPVFASAVGRGKEPRDHQWDLAVDHHEPSLR